MATRDGLPIDLIWVLVNLTASQIDAFRATAMSLHQGAIADAVISENRSAGWSDTPPTGLRQALIKIATTEVNLRNVLPPGPEAAIVRVFTEADHDEAFTMVLSPEWIS